VHLFAGTHTDDPVLAIRADRLGHVGDAIRGNFRDQDLAAPGVLQAPQDHLHAFLETDIETSHLRIGDRQHAGFALLEEERDHRAAAAHDIAVAHHAETKIARAFDIVRRDEELVRAQLGRAVEIDGRRSLVGRERHHAFHAAVQTGFDDVLRSEDVRLDALERIVFRHRHLLERRGMDDDIDAFERAAQTRFVAHVADEIADRLVFARRILLRHLELLQLVAREDHQPLQTRIPLEHGFHEGLAEGTGAAGEQNAGGIEGERAGSCRFHVVRSRLRSAQANIVARAGVGWFSIGPLLSRPRTSAARAHTARWITDT
jgi:hypothetical protein